MTKLHTKAVDELFHAILSLENLQECYQLFEDVCTVNEIQDMAQRFSVAQMLAEGRVYSDISKETGASTATISRVNKCLHYGSDGYRLVLERRKNGEET